MKFKLFLVTASLFSFLTLVVKADDSNGTYRSEFTDEPLPQLMMDSRTVQAELEEVEQFYEGFEKPLNDPSLLTESTTTSSKRIFSESESSSHDIAQSSSSVLENSLKRKRASSFGTEEEALGMLDSSQLMAGNVTFEEGKEVTPLESSSVLVKAPLPLKGSAEAKTMGYQLFSKVIDFYYIEINAFQSEIKTIQKKMVEEASRISLAKENPTQQGRIELECALLQKQLREVSITSLEKSEQLYKSCNKYLLIFRKQEEATSEISETYDPATNVFEAEEALLPFKTLSDALRLMLQATEASQRGAELTTKETYVIRQGRNHAGKACQLANHALVTAVTGKQTIVRLLLDRVKAEEIANRKETPAEQKGNFLSLAKDNIRKAKRINMLLNRFIKIAESSIQEGEAFFQMTQAQEGGRSEMADQWYQVALSFHQVADLFDQSKNAFINNFEDSERFYDEGAVLFLQTQENASHLEKVIPPPFPVLSDEPIFLPKKEG